MMRLIACWGSSGAGKTTLAMALATRYAGENRDVLLLSAETRTPLLPVLLPTTKSVNGENSLGALLCADTIDEAALKNKMLHHPGSAHVYCMGLASGELSAITYPTPTRAACSQLLSLLHTSPFDIIIVDCDSSPLWEPLTLTALEQADATVVTVTPDVKGYEFLKAQTIWLRSSDIFKPDDFLRVASPVFPFSPIREARALFGGFSFELPWAESVAQKMLAGELLTGLDDRAGVIYASEVGRLAKQLWDKEVEKT